MTWAEFLRWAAAQGVQDTDEIGYIDFDGTPATIRRTEHTPPERAVTIVSIT